MGSNRRSSVRRRALVVVCSVAFTLVLSPARANVFSSLLDYAEDYGSRGWSMVSGATSSAISAVGDVVVNDVGRPVAYQVSSGTVPIARAVTNGQALQFVAHGAEGAYTGATIHVRRIGETVAEGTVEIGTITIDEAGDLSCDIAHTVVDGVTYAYENGMIVVANLAGMSCNSIADLVAPNVDFGGASPDVAVGNCAANIGVGFACAAPSGVMDLMSASEGMYREILSASYQSPCNRMPIPPVNLVCGTVRRSVNQVNALASCVMNLRQLTPPGGQFGASECRSIGEIIFGLLLDVATDGANTTNVLRKIALAVMDIYQISMDVNDLTNMISSVCSGLTGQLAPTPAPPATGITLFANKDYAGTSLAVTTHLPTLGTLDNAVSSIRLGDGITVAVFSEAHYQGACDTIGGSINRMNFSNVGNDHASSIRVGEACPARPAVRLYQDSEFTGRRVEIGSDVPSLAGIGFDNETTSAQLIGGGVALYSEPFYGGTCTEMRFPTVSPLVRTFVGSLMGNDRVSSVRVGMRCEPVTAIFYANTNYTGSPTQVAGDVLNTSGTPYANASSVNVLNSRRPMSVYKEPNFEGECLDLSASRSSFPSGWNDGIRSIRINASCAGRNATIPASALVTDGNRCLGARAQTTAERDLCYQSCLGGTAAACRANCDQRETLVAERCTGENEQRFYMRGAFLRNYANKCVHTLVSRLALEGGHVSLAPCNDLVAGLSQSYYVRDSSLVNSQGRCLAIRDSNLFDDTATVIVHQCDGSPGERFTTTPWNAAMQYPGERPASPSGAVLSCDFDVGAAGKLTCQSGSEALSFVRPSTIFLEATASRLPFDGALSFRADSPPIEIPARDAHDPSDGSYTVAFWFNASGNEDPQPVFVHGAESPGVPGVSVRIEGGALRLRVVDEGHAHVAELARPFTEVNGWHHFVGVIDRDAQVIRAYFDGDASGFSDVANAASNAVDITAFGPIDDANPTPTCVGACRPSMAFRGSMDALRLYRRAVTPAEIAMLRAGR